MTLEIMNANWMANHKISNEDKKNTANTHPHSLIKTLGAEPILHT